MESLNPNNAGINIQQDNQRDNLTVTAATLVVAEKEQIKMDPAGIVKSPEIAIDAIEIPVMDVREGQLPPGLEAELRARAEESGRFNKYEQDRMQ